MSEPPYVFDPTAGCVDGFADEMAKIRAEVNQINTSLGLRPYRVYSVRMLWSGNEIGHGEVSRVLEREYLPRPKVEFRTRRDLQPMGWIERGVVTLTEINAQLAPAEVADLFALTQPLRPGEETWIEIQLDGRYGTVQPRRRFVPGAPPERRAFEWRLELKQQTSGRAPDGTPTAQGAVRPF